MTRRPTRATSGGRAYLDLRKAASAAGRPTDELLQLYALEGLLDRLSGSPHADRFVLKGGVLLAAFDASSSDAGRRSGGVELVLAEKIVTAIQRGTANTRWRDFVDIAALAHLDIDDGTLVESIRRVASFRQAPIQPLRDVLAGYPEIAQQQWAAWRRKQALAATTPARFEDLVDTVVAFRRPVPPARSDDSIGRRRASQRDLSSERGATQGDSSGSNGAQVEGHATFGEATDMAANRGCF